MHPWLWDRVAGHESSGSCPRRREPAGSMSFAFELQAFQMSIKVSSGPGILNGARWLFLIATA